MKRNDLPTTLRAVRNGSTRMRRRRVVWRRDAGVGTGLAVLLLVACSRSPGNPPSPEPTRTSTGSSEIRLSPPGEPGQVLSVRGVLVRAEDRTPVPHQPFLIYQADAQGDYEARDPDDERTARLAARVTTDEFGRFTLRTIMPGAYGNPLGDPHLHLEIDGATPPMHVVYFEGFVQEDTIRWQKTTDQAHIAPVERGSDGSIATDLILPVRGFAQSSIPAPVRSQGQ